MPLIELSQEAIEDLHNIQEMIFWDDVLGDIGTWEGRITQAEVKQELDEAYEAWLEDPDLVLHMIAEEMDEGDLSGIISKDLPYTEVA